MAPFEFHKFPYQTITIAAEWALVCVSSTIIGNVSLTKWPYYLFFCEPTLLAGCGFCLCGHGCVCPHMCLHVCTSIRVYACLNTWVCTCMCVLHTSMDARACMRVCMIYNTSCTAPYCDMLYYIEIWRECKQVWSPENSKCWPCQCGVKTLALIGIIFHMCEWRLTGIC